MTNTQANEIRAGVFFLMHDQAARLCPTGHRLVGVSWKITQAMKDKAKASGQIEPKKHSAMGIYVAVLRADIVVEPTSLESVLCDAFESIQDGLVIGWLNEAKDEGKSLVGLDLPNNLQNVRGIAEASKVQAVSGRLTKEALQDWFMDNLMLPIGEKLVNLGIAPERAEKVVSIYMDGYASLSNPQVTMKEEDCRKLLEQASKLSQTGQDRVTVKVVSKLQGILAKIAEQAKAKEEDFIALG